MSETAGELLARMDTDAMKWAEEFVRIVREHDTADPLDEGFMVGWFANALGVGEDRGRAEAMREVEEALRRESLNYKDPMLRVGLLKAGEIVGLRRREAEERC